VRRNRSPSVDKYIDIRIQQLEEDRDKCHSEYDQQWYNRIISELYWVKSNINSDCFMEQEQPQ